MSGGEKAVTIGANFDGGVAVPCNITATALGRFSTGFQESPALSVKVFPGSEYSPAMTIVASARTDIAQPIAVSFVLICLPRLMRLRTAASTGTARQSCT